MRKLEEIIEDFDNLRESFKTYRQKGELGKGALTEFQARFVDLKAELRPFKIQLVKDWIRRDDKSASAIKFRIALAIHEGEFKDEEGKLIYDQCSISAAEKFASGSDKYKKFVDERAFYKASLTNVTDLRNDCDSFTNLIKDLLKTVN